MATIPSKALGLLQMSFIIDCFNGSDSNSLLFFKSSIRSLNLDTFLLLISFGVLKP
nr:MAG TPA: hypothetical protein [Caudoviricetes sp.]